MHITRIWLLNCVLTESDQCMTSCLMINKINTCYVRTWFIVQCVVLPLHRKALVLLKKKRYQDQLLDKTETQISNLERMVRLRLFLGPIVSFTFIECNYIDVMFCTANLSSKTYPGRVYLGCSVWWTLSYLTYWCVFTGSVLGPPILACSVNVFTGSRHWVCPDRDESHWGAEGWKWLSEEYAWGRVWFAS